jgi:hypothetical protein
MTTKGATGDASACACAAESTIRDRAMIEPLRVFCATHLAMAVVVPIARCLYCITLIWVYTIVLVGPTFRLLSFFVQLQGYVYFTILMLSRTVDELMYSFAPPAVSRHHEHTFKQSSLRRMQSPLAFVRHTVYDTAADRVRHRSSSTRIDLSSLRHVRA